MPKHTISVTGHRDMLETESIRQEISDFFDKQLLEYDTLTLLSPLATGADTLVAKIFLEKKEKHTHLELEVPLPFEQSVYEKDFDAESREVFLKYMEQASDSYVVPRQEEHAYKNLGQYIVKHSDILLALWDGTVNHKEGGTSDVVAFALEQGCEVKHILVQRKT